MCIVVTMFNHLQLDSCHTCHMISSFDCLEIMPLRPSDVKEIWDPALFWNVLGKLALMKSYPFTPFH